MTTYEKFCSLDIDGGLIALEKAGEDYADFFCYPADARAIGFEGCIMYCFLGGCDETVFACNPESCTDIYVYPVARSFDDFMRLILACGSANPVEQIVWMDRERFERHLREEQDLRTAEQKALLALLERELQITAMEDPYEYVKSVQADFDYGKIPFRDEYYSALGIER